MTVARNNALTAVCELLEEMGMTAEDVRGISLDLTGEWEARQIIRKTKETEEAA